MEKTFSALERLSSMFDTFCRYIFVPTQPRPLSWNTSGDAHPSPQVALALRKTDPMSNYSSGT